MNTDKRTADTSFRLGHLAAESLRGLFAGSWHQPASDIATPWLQSSIELVLGLEVTEAPMDSTWGCPL